MICVSGLLVMAIGAAAHPCAGVVRPLRRTIREEAARQKALPAQLPGRFRTVALQLLQQLQGDAPVSIVSSRRTGRTTNRRLSYRAGQRAGSPGFR
ncbi:hypothetical protein RHECNPAF_2330075 [Rhizobium etli CNPAF512]|nr:hypothetical protein RHECNPAF_2330075 [Rhizobium etli CNPAF512]